MNLEMFRANELDFLADQGILLLNSALTTTYNKPDSHLLIWEPFIKYVIEILNKKDKLIFCGFGKVANTLLINVDISKHIVFEREHPAASAYQNRDWKHDNLFSKTNEILYSIYEKEIKWDTYLVPKEDDLPF